MSANSTAQRHLDANQTQTTSFQLAWFPGMTHLEPLAVGGNGRYAGSRVKSVTVTAPKVSLSLECPNSPPSDTINLAQGYGMTLQQLDQAIESVTDGVGLPWLVSAAANPTIPVYAVRVEPITYPKPNGPTHMLRLELRGTHAASSLPMTQTGQDAWALDTNGVQLDFEGTVTRQSTTLTVALTGGSAQTDGDPLEFEPATVVLQALGD
jgi:hypothetical protein